LFFYGRPIISSIYPATFREQGGTTISVYGSGFLDTEIGKCSFNASIFTDVIYYNQTCIECHVPAVHSEIDFNSSVPFYVGNDNAYYNQQPNEILYYPFCYGFPPCGGDLKGHCNVTTPPVHPFCQCTTSGFDNATYCSNCLPDHYGHLCTPCNPCNHGTCNDGFDLDGSCTCDVGYTSLLGPSCTFAWGLWIALPAGCLVVGIMVLACVIKVLKNKYCNEKDKKRV